MNLQIVSLIICHSALHILFGHLYVPYTSQVKSMSSDLSCLLVSDSILLTANVTDSPIASLGGAMGYAW